MVIRRGLTPTPKWSNCSGKHTGLIGQAKHAGWPLAGYEKEGHPVQQRVQAEVERWTGLASDQLTLAIDGCATVCFGLPLRAMAVAYARFATWSDPAAKRIWRAMTAHPELVAGTGRLCTELMRSWPGEIVAKVGAEGVYCAAVPTRGWGIGLKVEDGTWESANLALLEVLRSLLTKDGGLPEPLGRIGNLIRSTNPPVKNTRGAEVGETRISGELEFFAD
jgi:L-asparaginase II